MWHTRATIYNLFMNIPYTGIIYRDTDSEEGQWGHGSFNDENGTQYKFKAIDEDGGVHLLLDDGVGEFYFYSVFSDNSPCGRCKITVFDKQKDYEFVMFKKSNAMGEFYKLKENTKINKNVGEKRTH